MQFFIAFMPLISREGVRIKLQEFATGPTSLSAVAVELLRRDGSGNPKQKPELVATKIYTLEKDWRFHPTENGGVWFRGFFLFNCCDCLIFFGAKC